MTIKKYIYNNNLRKPDYVKVVIDGDFGKYFKYPEQNKLVGEYIKERAKENFFGVTAEIYYSIDWDTESLYCKYEVQA